MKIVAVVLLLGTLVSGRPEPPAPGYSTTHQDAFSAPSFDAPSSSYGPPSGAYSGPSSTYGAPSGAYSSPSNTYGAPSSSSRYANAPSASKSSFTLGGRSSSRRNSHSGRYGAPALTAAIIRSSGLSSTYGAPSSTYGAPGASSSFRGALSSVYGAPGGGFNGYANAKALLAQDDLSEPANYDFSYGVQDAYSGSNFGHQENREDDSARGEYRVLLPDGRTQIVEYEADQAGYRPNIRYEEPSGPYAASQRSHGPGGPY